MLFQERTTDTGYSYRVEDVFGVIELLSPEPLDAPTLDALAMHVMKSGSSEGTINGAIAFTYEKAPNWIEDDEEEAVIT